MTEVSLTVVEMCYPKSVKYKISKLVKAKKNKRACPISNS